MIDYTFYRLVVIALIAVPLILSLLYIWRSTGGDYDNDND